MTPEEKIRQADILTPNLMKAAQIWAKGHANALMQTKTFPTMNTFERDFSKVGMGMWTVIVDIESKSYLKKGLLKVFAYQVYHVDRAKDFSNLGCGIWMMHLKSPTNAVFIEYTPHYLSRLRTRFMEPNGIVRTSFKDIVKFVLRETVGTIVYSTRGYRYEKDKDGHYYRVQDHCIDRKEGYDNLVAYHHDGITLGIEALNGRYRNFTTFISNDLLHDGQAERQKENLALSNKAFLRKQKNHHYSLKIQNETEI